MKLFKKNIRRKLFKSITLFAGLVLVLNMSMIGVFFNVGVASASVTEAVLIKTPITTCQGSGELFLYQGDPFQPIDTSFTVSRNQLLIFTKGEASISAQVNSNPVALTTVFDQASPFHVKVYSITTTSGDTVSITGTSPEGARYVQGYIAQDFVNPVFNIDSLNVVYNHGASATLYNTMYLNPGAYSYVIFDKYTKNDLADAGPDTRNLNVNISGSNGVMLNQDYTQPSPSPVEGAVVGNYTVSEKGSYTMKIDTTDSVYWPVAQCEVTCAKGGIEFDLNPEMWVLGDGCYSSARVQDMKNINVPIGGNYNVKGIVHRGGFYNGENHGQENESFYLSINGKSGATSTDDLYKYAISQRLDDLGNFIFTEGNNTVYMNTASKCPPDQQANSVEVSKLCLYKTDECGDGVKNGDEQCDDDNDNNNDGCANNCTLNTCGDGKINNGEVCDDGSGVNATPCVPAYGGTCTYCSGICSEIELTGPYCGDGVKSGNEQCDGTDGVGANQSCSASCTLEEILCEAALDVVFIMDRSGSMDFDSPTRLSQAKSAANSFADKLRTGDQSALVSYSSNYKTAVEVSLDKTLNNNHISTKTQINSLAALGGTNIGVAIDRATQESISVNANPQATKVQILLTDGRANKPNGDGINENPLDVAYAIAESTEAAAQGIIIFTIGLGSDVNTTMLQAIAANTGGQYYHAPTGNDLDAIFNSISHRVCEYGSISGCKYKDTNNDGNISGEPKLSGWKINLTNGSVNLSQLTDQSGCYAFSGLSAGNYTVSEDAVQSAPFVQTYPVSPSTYSITLSAGQEVVNKNFGNYILECGNNIQDHGEECDDGNKSNGDGCSSTCQLEICGPTCGDGTINQTSEQCDDGNDINNDGCTNQCTLPSGGPEYGSIKACKYMDADGSLITNTDRTPVFGWEFILDDGAATTSQMTNQQIGCTVFNNLLTGNYGISETLGAGWVALLPNTGTSTVAVSANQETLINFINTKHGLISGYKFEDNDLASSTNPLLPKEGWIINLAYTAASTTLIASTTTNVSGYYEFTVMPGEYTITENMPAHWGAIGSSSLNAVITSGLSLINNNFTNHLFCGDGVVNQEVEQCDGTAGVGANQSCTAECKIENVLVCGDNTVNQSSEQCDDGNITGGDGCSASCTTEGGGGGGTFIATNGGGGGPIVLGEIGEPILTIEKSVNMKFANPGDEVEYRVKIINHGNLTAFNVTMNDTLPAGFTFSADGSSVKTINVGDLGPGENKEFVYKAKVSDKTVSGIYANVAQAVASNHNPVSDYADVEVKEIEVLGEELAPTGFKPSELVILLFALTSLLGASLFFRRKFYRSHNS